MTRRPIVSVPIVLRNLYTDSRARRRRIVRSVVRWLCDAVMLIGTCAAIVIVMQVVSQ